MYVVQMEAKEQELQRNLKQFDTFMTSQSERVRERLLFGNPRLRVC